MKNPAEENSNKASLLNMTDSGIHPAIIGHEERLLVEQSENGGNRIPVVIDVIALAVIK
jgi:hypothetical protein